MRSAQEDFVPVFPDRVKILVAEGGGNFFNGAGIVNAELAGGAAFDGFRFEFDAAALESEVEVVAARAGVAAGVGFRAGRDVGDPEREKGVAQAGGFAGGENDADGGKAEPEGGDELDEGAIGKGKGFVGSVLIVSGVGLHAGESDGEGGFPAMFEKVFKVGGEGEGFMFPVGEAEESADSDAAETSGVGPFGAVEPPVEFSFWSRGVKALVGFLMIGFLINDEAFRAVIHKVAVLVIFHRPNFDAEGGDEGGQGVQAALKVAV